MVRGVLMANFLVWVRLKRWRHIWYNHTYTNPERTDGALASEQSSGVGEWACPLPKAKSGLDSQLA